MIRSKSTCVWAATLFTVLLLATQLILPHPLHANKDSENREVRMGREAARDIERGSRLITDPEITERVERIGKSIAEVANSQQVPASYGDANIVRFDYQFKVIDDESVNAFSLPGGFIYVNSGLLGYVESDHELAGVLAHEVAHAAHHHMVHLLREQSKMDGRIAFLLLAGLLGGLDGESLGNLMIGAQLLSIAKTSGYGQKAEADADVSAVEYLVRAGHNPVGMLTFLERLARDYSSRPRVELGILQTHPAPMDRCRSVLGLIENLGLPINRRSVTRGLQAEPVLSTVNGRQVTQVLLGDNILFTAAPIGDAISSEERARFVAKKVNCFLDSEPVMRDVRLGPDDVSVLAGAGLIVKVMPEDSDFTGKPAEELAREAVNVLKRAIWSEIVARTY